ncbi:hypothetical protein HD806DRAFT_528936 [Xylariaceae sp. AK1471]|nr:hypothetical protein HD806DRAFT_528936 [Xylariaceae sp. AK1471]
MDAYCFLCNNFNFASRKDEIILVGFSRGGFAVRCLASFITEVGLIRRKHLSLLPNVFDSWCRGNGKVDPKYRDARISLAVRIKVLAEWDTVSALWSTKFGFIQGEIPSAVDNAFQAIALDEQRLSFQPMLWTKRGQIVERWEAEETNRRVEQCLFNGHHGDIGGGNSDSGLSTIALLWMISRIESVTKRISIEERYYKQSYRFPPPHGWIRFSGTQLPSFCYVNPPSWWWSLQHYLAFNLFDGNRYRWLNETVRKKYDLEDTLKVHFTVPLLKEGAVKKCTVVDPISRKIKLWDRLELPWQLPNSAEVEMWTYWRDEARRWKPDRSSEEDDMEDWGTIIETLGMQASPRESGSPVVFRVFDKMRKQSKDTYKLFTQRSKDRKPKSP